MSRPDLRGRGHLIGESSSQNIVTAEMFCLDFSTRNPDEPSVECIYTPGKKVCITTTLEGTVANVEWKVQNFSKIFKDDMLKSPEFTSDNRKYSWSLTLHRRAESGYNDTLFIRWNRNDLPANYKIRFALINNKNERINESETNYSDGNWIDLIGMGELNKKKDSYINKDSLTIVCDIYKPYKPTHVLREEHGVKVSKTEHWLVEDLTKLLECSDLSDITLSVEGKPSKEFKLHKSILAARSTFFAAMFSIEMAEASASFIKISDRSPELMEEVIRYIYTGKVPKLKKMVKDLFMAADYYDLEGLKEICSEEMSSNLTSDNSIEMLEMADSFKFSAKFLKDEVLDFIARNSHEVFKSESWKKLEHSNPELEKDIYKAIVQKNFM